MHTRHLVSVTAIIIVVPCNGGTSPKGGVVCTSQQSRLVAKSSPVWLYSSLSFRSNYGVLSDLEWTAARAEFFILAFSFPFSFISFSSSLHWEVCLYGAVILQNTQHWAVFFLDGVPFSVCWNWHSSNSCLRVMSTRLEGALLPDAASRELRRRKMTYIWRRFWDPPKSCQVPTFISLLNESWHDMNCNHGKTRYLPTAIRGQKSWYQKRGKEIDITRTSMNPLQPLTIKTRRTWVRWNWKMETWERVPTSPSSPKKVVW